MNFKGWEKIKEDKQSVTMKHPKGHEMVLAVKALPKIQQEQLKRLKLAKGGQIDDNLASGEEKGVSTQGRDVRWAKTHKNRGETEEAKQGMDFAKEEAKGRAEHERKTVKPKLKGLAHGGKVAHYDDGTPDSTVQKDDAQKQDDQGSGQPAPTPTVNVNVNGQAPQPVPNPAPVSGAPATPASQVPVPDVKTVQPNNPQPGNGIGGQAQESLNSYNQGKAGLENQANVDAAKKQALIQPQEEALDTAQKIADSEAQNKQMIQAHTQELNDYIAKNPINPRAYVENMGALRKADTAIGLFMGGLGTAFGGKNFAFDALQKQIDRDVQAQQQNVENHKTILGAWQQLYGDNNVSTALAKASMLDIYAKRADLIGNKLGTPQAQANKQLLLQKLGQESDELRSKAAYLGARMGLDMSGKTPPVQNNGGSAPQNNNPSAKGGATGAWNEGRKDRILGPKAEALYKASLNKYNTTMSEEEKKNIQNEYLDAQKTDDALDQIDKLYPEMAGKATLGGWLSDKINPNAMGVVAGGATEAAALAGAIPSGGLTAAAGVPLAAAVGGGAMAAGHTLQGVATGLGGQEEVQYERAKNSFKSIVTSALSRSGMTPSEAQRVADEYAPTRFTSAATDRDALEKIKQKIISLQQHGTLKAKGVTNQGKE